jgi:methylenetetrahydrofolate--tRNA-(uracil-5-)-methyltransferase
MSAPLIHVVGGGLAGSEAAWQAAEAGAQAVVHEMRPVRATEAHVTDRLAELVCSNSFRSDDAETNAVGLLHQEMRRLGSLVMRAADTHRVPAGGALAVDREGFAQAVTDALEGHPRIEVRREEVPALPPVDWGPTIVATGPLTSSALAAAIQEATGLDQLAFFDAIAPIVHVESIDMSKAWFQSRYDKGETEADKAAYINCPLDKAQYEAFLDALLAAPATEFKDWERDTPYFEGCLPIEVMAARGRETLRHGPMKPRGLTNPRDPDVKSYAVVQLRQDNALGTLFNIVGFQTKIRHAAQVDVLRMIPGLEQAQFARLGGIHRNTFLNSPALLDATLRMTARPHIRFAGQVTGVEGYLESAAMGLLAGRFAAADALGRRFAPPPASTAFGALLGHVTGGHLLGGKGSFQPMNVNFGLFPPVEPPPRAPDAPRRRGAAKAEARKRAWTNRARADLEAWLADATPALADAGG